MSYGARHVPETKQLDAQRSCVAAGECRPRARSSKPTGRWCKGREGIPHAWVWEADPDWANRGDGRWVHQRRVCFGCGRKGWRGWRPGTRLFCGACGSPERWFYVDREGRHVEPTGCTRYGSMIIQASWRSMGPFCLCPEHYDVRAMIGPRWHWRWMREEAWPWADDPAQILQLRGLAR